MSNFRWGMIGVAAVTLFVVGCGAPEPPPVAEPYAADLVKAVGCLERGETDEALTLLQHIVDLAPSNAVARLNLGVACEQAGRLPEAVDAYSEAAALNPHDARPLELAARIYMQVEDWDGARRMLDQANRREAYSPRILTTMGVVEYRAGNLDMAEAFFDAAIKADTTYASALYNAAVLQRDARKDRERAVGLFEAYLECAPENDPRRAAVRAFVAAQQAEPEPLPVTVASTPSSSAPEAGAAPDRVVKVLTEVDAAIENGAFDVALVALKHALAQGADPDLQWRLADLYRQHLGMADKAQAIYGAFAQTYPSDPRVAEISSLMSSTAAPAAHVKAPARPSVTAPPDEAPSQATAKRLWTRALKAQRQGDLDRAKVLYKAALDQDPTLFGAWYNLGLVAKDEGDLPLAQQAFEKALTLRADWPDALFMLAVVLHKQGEDERATALLDRLLTLQPRHVKANYLLAVIYANAGRRGMARTHFEHVLRFDGNGTFGRQARDWLNKNERKPPPAPKR